LVKSVKETKVHAKNAPPKHMQGGLGKNENLKQARRGKRWDSDLETVQSRNLRRGCQWEKKSPVKATATNQEGVANASTKLGAGGSGKYER